MSKPTHHSKTAHPKSAHRSKAPEPKKPDLKNTRVVVGTHAINEAMKTNVSRVQNVWLQKGFESSEDLRELEQQCRGSRIPMEIRSKEQLTKDFPAHQGAVLIVEGRPRLDWDNLAEKKESLVLFLDGIEDP